MNATVTWEFIKEKDKCEVEFYLNGTYCAQGEFVVAGEILSKEYYREELSYIEVTLILWYYDEIVKDYVKEML